MLLLNYKNMSNTLKIAGAFAVLFAAFASAVLYFSNPFAVFGSVTMGNDYQSQLITSSLASSTAITQLKSIGGSVGSVVLASSSAQTTYPSLVIYDATSTMATSTAKVIGRFGGANQTHGTYTFDSYFTYGLSVEVPVGFNGAYTITWR